VIKQEVDHVVFGAGIFGLYATLLLKRRGSRVLVVDAEPRPLMRASLVNQARLHTGYHYPRSMFTALRSASYADRFATDFPGAIKRDFNKIYAIARWGSVTDVHAFSRFCSQLGIPLRQVDARPWLQPGAVDSVWETREYVFDAEVIRCELLSRIERAGGARWAMGATIVAGVIDGEHFDLQLSTGERVQARGLVNAAYAGVNRLVTMFGLEPLPLKYELTEVALAKAPLELQNIGITVMDGPFFSTMPFGLTGIHTVTSVPHTPRATSFAAMPEFRCQDGNPSCSPTLLANCSSCAVRPKSAWALMERLAATFLDPHLTFEYQESLFTVKAVLRTSELDDGRPTLMVQHRTNPFFISVLSGKVSTIYDLEAVL